MKTFAVLLVLAAMAWSQAFADLYCYSCFSYESEHKCWENRRKIKCASQDGRHVPVFDTCIKFEVDVKVVESKDGTQKQHVVENKGYGMDCGNKINNCFLHKCRNYWGIHGQFLDDGCKVQCCKDKNSTCEMPDQTPIQADGGSNVVEAGARSSRGTQFESGEFTILLLLMAKLTLLFV